MRKLQTIITILALSFSVMPVGNAAKAKLEVGDYVEAGVYNSRPMVWQYVGDDANGKLMLCDSVICYKAFDASGEHKTDLEYGPNREWSGSNRWSESNIRCWLNSDADVVDYVCGVPPAKTEIDQMNAYNFDENYSKEKGFLTNFSEADRALIKTVTQRTALNEIDEMFADGKYQSIDLGKEWAFTNVEKSYELTEDKVFLIDELQVRMAIENLGADSVATWKKGCDRYQKYILDEDSIEANTYFLRSAITNERSAAQVNSVFIFGGKTLNGASWTNTPYGIRPAFYLADDASFKRGDGTAENPYRLSDHKITDAPVSAMEYIMVVRHPFEVEVCYMSKVIDFPDAKPYIDENDRTQVPIRALAEKLQYTVDYDEADKIVTIKKGDKLITLAVGSNELDCNGTKVQMDTAAVIKEDRVYIPVRFMGEALGYGLDYFEYN